MNTISVHGRALHWRDSFFESVTITSDGIQLQIERRKRMGATTKQEYPLEAISPNLEVVTRARIAPMIFTVLFVLALCLLAGFALYGAMTAHQAFEAFGIVVLCSILAVPLAFFTFAVYDRWRSGQGDFCLVHDVAHKQLLLAIPLRQLTEMDIRQFFSVILSHRREKESALTEEKPLCLICRQVPPSEPTASLCAACRDTQLQRPLPSWIKYVAGGIATLIVLTLARTPGDIMAAAAFKRGQRAEQAQDFSTAMANYERARVRYPQSIPILARLAVTSYNGGELGQTMRCLDQLAGKETSLETAREINTLIEKVDALLATIESDTSTETRQ